jgi:hypothetical protein
MSKTLAILAHRDDEIFLIEYLLTCEEIFVVYLTESHDFEIRRYESVRALNYLRGFLSISEISVRNFAQDGKLHDYLTSTLLTELSDFVKVEQITQILSLSYEGGHQDHDSASIISKIIAEFFSIDLLLFPTYRASAAIFPPFQVMKSKDVKNVSMKMNRRLNFQIALALMLIYRSQWRTWLGLGPLVLKRSLSKYSGVPKLSKSELIVHVHCLYERRNRASQKDVFARLRLFSESKDGWLS